MFIDFDRESIQKASLREKFLLEDNSCPGKKKVTCYPSADDSLGLCRGAIEQKCRESQLAVCQRVPL